MPAKAHVPRSAQQANRAAEFIKALKREDLLVPSHKQAPAKKAEPFKIPRPPPGVVPDGAPMAMDDASTQQWSQWATAFYGQWSFTEGLEFLGYPYLAELAQRPEYRKLVEIIASECTRKWIKFEVAGDGEDKTEKIKDIEAALVLLNARDAYRRIAEQDGFYGRAHLYHDFGDGDNPDELQTTVGNGRDQISEMKVGKNKPLIRLQPIEPVWTYPTHYNTSDPLAADWYKPDMWYIMGKRVHVSRAPVFIGREVPDLLKPAYSFGGLALTQMAKPYVDNWLVTRQGVQDIINSFTVFCLMTAMAEQMQVGGEVLQKRANVFNQFRNNRGLMLVDKELEDFKNVSAPLGGLDHLQAQSQEHMAAVASIPLVKLLGITPSGLNASSEGEIRVFYDWIAAYQNAFMRPNLTRTIDFVQLSLFGKVDEDILFNFVPLYELNEKEQAEVDKTKAETAQVRIDTGIISQEEERERLAADPASPYPGLDPEDVPDLLEEEEAGLVPKGGGAGVAAELGAKPGGGNGAGKPNGKAPPPAKSKPNGQRKPA